jgi:probable 2-oxoglutarate dehydrogenase E1 component DHKTD1
MEFSHLGKEFGATGIERERLDNIITASVDLPKEGFTAHERLTRTHVGARLKAHKEDSIDWATAEALAFGSLLQDGYNIRLSGEDVERGTFSHRHIKLTDQTNEKKHIPLIDSEYMKRTSKGRLSVNNSNLAENGPLAYEVGYSMENPKNLSLWEAQYGDFYNPS